MPRKGQTFCPSPSPPPARQKQRKVSNVHNEHSSDRREKAVNELSHPHENQADRQVKVDRQKEVLQIARQIDRQIGEGRQRDKGRQIDRGTVDRQIDRQIGRSRQRDGGRQIDRGRQINRQIDRQIDRGKQIIVIINYNNKNIKVDRVRDIQLDIEMITREREKRNFN